MNVPQTIPYVSSISRIIGVLILLLTTVIGGIMVTQTQIIDAIHQQKSCADGCTGFDKDAFATIKKFSVGIFVFSIIALIIDLIIIQNKGISSSSIGNKFAASIWLIMSILLSTISGLLYFKIKALQDSIKNCDTACNFVGLSDASRFLLGSMIAGIVSGVFAIVLISHLVKKFGVPSPTIPDNITSVAADIQRKLQFRIW